MSSPERRESRPQDARPTEAAQPVDDRFPSAAEGDVPPPASPVVPPVPAVPSPDAAATEEASPGDASAGPAESTGSSADLSAQSALDDAEKELLSAMDEALAAAEAQDDEEEQDGTPRWDANDPRRKKDCFAPPTDACQCHCLHCGREFSSDAIWFQRVINDPQGFEGFWMCPTPNCSGAGFTFDIFPVDPNHPANEGWHYDDEEDDDFVPDDEDDNEIDSEQAVAEWAEAIAEDAEAEYDPSESKYKDMDEFLGNDDDDLEGEEWKFGLQPGERPANAMQEEADREWQREQEMYDEPDQRPRVLDWSNREDRKFGPGLPYEGGDGTFREDDIPF